LNEVYILDSLTGILMTAKFKEDHLVLMAKRGWIVQNTWLFENRTVNSMSVYDLEEYLKEAA